MVSQLPLLPWLVPLQHTLLICVALESCSSYDSLDSPVPIVRGLLASSGMVLPNTQHLPNCHNSALAAQEHAVENRPPACLVGQLYSETAHGSEGHSRQQTMPWWQLHCGQS